MTFIKPYLIVLTLIFPMIAGQWAAGDAELDISGGFIVLIKHGEKNEIALSETGIWANVDNTGWKKVAFTPDPYEVLEDAHVINDTYVLITEFIYVSLLEKW